MTTSFLRGYNYIHGTILNKNVHIGMILGALPLYHIFNTNIAHFNYEQARFWASVTLLILLVFKIQYWIRHSFWLHLIFGMLMFIFPVILLNQAQELDMFAMDHAKILFVCTPLTLVFTAVMLRLHILANRVLVTVFIVNQAYIILEILLHNTNLLALTTALITLLLICITILEYGKSKTRYVPSNPFVVLYTINNLTFSQMQGNLDYARIPNAIHPFYPLVLCMYDGNTHDWLIHRWVTLSLHFMITYGLFGPFLPTALDIKYELTSMCAVCNFLCIPVCIHRIGCVYYGEICDKFKFTTGLYINI